MNRMSRWTWLPVVAFLAAPALAAPPPKAVDAKQAETKLIKAGVIAGELVHIEPGKQSIRVKITIPHQEINQGALKAYQQAFWKNWQEQMKEQQENIDRLQKLMQTEQERLQELQRSWPEEGNQ